MKRAVFAVALLLGAAVASAEDVRFSNTFAVTDTKTREFSLSTKVENLSGRDQDIFVTRNGVRQKVGTLRPGGRASVTVLPLGNGVYVWDEEGGG